MASDAKYQIKMLVEKLERQGLTVKPAGSGHLRVYKDGKPIYTLPSTPSDSRSVENSYAAMRRLGYDVRLSRNKRKGSADDFAVQRLRKRLEAALQRVTMSELSRLMIVTQEQRHISGSKSASAAAQIIKSLRDRPNGRVTKTIHDAIAATLSIVESSDDKVLARKIAEANEHEGVRRSQPTPLAPKVESKSPPVRVELEPEIESPVADNVMVIELRIPASERAFLRELVRELQGVW